MSPRGSVRARVVFPEWQSPFSSRARSRGAPSARARAREARSRCLAASLSSPDRSTRARVARIRPRASRFPARHVPDTLVRRSYYARLMPSPNRRLRDARRRRRGRLRAPERHLQPGFRSLRNQEPVEFGLEPIGDGRFKAVNVRPTRLRPGHTPDVSENASARRFSFFFVFFRESDTRPRAPDDERLLFAQVTGPDGAFVQGAPPRNANKARSPFMANRGAGIPDFNHSELLR